MDIDSSMEPQEIGYILEELPRSEDVNDQSFQEENNQNLLVDATLDDTIHEEVVETCVPNFEIGTDLESVFSFGRKLVIKVLK